MIAGLVSVIVPVYNTLKYLDRCVSSIVNQTYSNLEILLIDDGSTDGSSQLCDDLANKDDRIKAFHKENAGAGNARNFGIDKANGEFAYFVDSDDYIDATLISKAYNAAHKNDAQVVVFDFNTLTSKALFLNRFRLCLKNRYIVVMRLSARFYPI